MLHCSDGNTDPLRQIVTLERSDDDFSREQLFKNRGSIADIYHHKICRARNEVEFHFGELLLEIGSAGVDGFLGLSLMHVVVERGECAGLGEAVDIEWLPGFLQNFHQFARSHAVADAQTGQAVNFGERAQNDNIPTVANVLKRVGRTIEELEISFIEHDDNVFGDPRHEIVDLVLRNQRTGWIVGIDDENDSRFRCNPFEHRV